MLLKVDCLPNAVGKQPSIPLIYLGRKWTLKWWWWWWWNNCFQDTTKATLISHPSIWQLSTHGNIGNNVNKNLLAACSGVFKGGYEGSWPNLWPWPLAERKNMKTWFGHLCVSISGQTWKGPPDEILTNKYVTGCMPLLMLHTLLDMVF